MLGALIVAVVAVLGWQLGRLTGEDSWRTDARKALFQSGYRPTTRGPILDRDGRPLAVERPSWEFQAHYETLTGDWAFRQAQRDAKREFGSKWSELSGSDRHGETMARIEPWEQAVERIWLEAASGDIDAATLAERQSDIRNQTGRLVEHIWQRRFEGLAEKYDDPAERFKMEPIAEQKGFHAVIDGLDDDGAFPLIRAIDELDRQIREAGGDPDRDPAFRIRDVSRRDRGYRRANVTLDRSTLPMPLRSDTPMMIEIDGVADTLIGSTRNEITREDEGRRPFRGIDGAGQPDLTGYDARHPSLVGSSGLELEFDRRLHGSIGYREENVATGETLADTDPIPGEAVRIAIDGDLQARVRAILDPDFGLMRSQKWQYGWRRGELREMTVPEGTPLQGAVVVIDVETGETLALVSTPNVTDLDLEDRDYRLLLMPDRTAQDRERIEALPPEDRARRDELIELAPFRNRAIATEYAPGSIVKPLVYMAGVEGGRLGTQEEIECRGYVRGTEIQNLRPRCWGWRPERKEFLAHGPLSPVEAISKSCNVYFYTIADRLGPVRLGRWYREGCGLEDEFGPGFGAALDGTFEESEAMGEIGRMIVGIGQGPFSWTPLHAATAYARLASGGAPVRPVMVLDPGTDSSPKSRRWEPAAVDIALAGMRASAREGTAARLRRTSAEGTYEPLLDFSDLGEGAPTVWAKTGTAQVTGKAPHAWYAGLVAPAGERTPKYAFAVIVEHGNSGGAAAGPVAGQLIRAMAAEGYLGDDARENLGATPVEWLDPIETFWVGSGAPEVEVEDAS